MTVVADHCDVHNRKSLDRVSVRISDEVAIYHVSSLYKRSTVDERSTPVSSDFKSHLTSKLSTLPRPPTTMQLLSLVVPLTSAIVALANIPIAQVTYDTIYDSANLSLNNVACSDGPNGLITKGYTTLGSLPNFPRIGGAGTISGWNSESCGSCYGLTYENTTIFVTAVDYAASGFNIALSAMNELTGGRAVQLGRVNAILSFADRSRCGF